MGLLINYRLTKTIFTAFLAVTIIMSSSVAIGSDTKITATKIQLRALFIKKIPKYVLWPEQANPTDGKPYTVATIDKDELIPYFNTPNAFKLVRWPSADCQVLFLDSKNPRVIAAILQRVKDDPILTIGQNPDFLRMGGIINLVKSGSRMKLQVNICAARKAGLTISSKLLKLSDIYCGDEAE
ncbi:YfiR family protein [Maridesulfovibrio frigidus]|uniref:YfiR family protein n=1 Tax=Maridesulfovibrio frigidus TaxID=340956 RepID=UPI0004E2038D|nr:YfiR family protein [Maridesulfovibrio frigidus]